MISGVSSTEHLELPPVWTNSIDLFVWLCVFTRDENQKFHAGPSAATFQGIK